MSEEQINEISSRLERSELRMVALNQKVHENVEAGNRRGLIAYVLLLVFMMVMFAMVLGGSSNGFLPF